MSRIDVAVSILISGGGETVKIVREELKKSKKSDINVILEHFPKCIFFYLDLNSLLDIWSTVNFLTIEQDLLRRTMFELPQILSPKQIIVPAGRLVLACPRCKQNLLLASEPCRLHGFSKFQWLWVNWSKRKRIKYGMIFVNWFFAPKPVK